jgi:hypothetical protein
MIKVLDVLVVEYMRDQAKRRTKMFCNEERQYKRQKNEDCKDIRAKRGERCKDDVARKRQCKWWVQDGWVYERWIFEPFEVAG